jgi:hypothetical protein
MLRNWQTSLLLILITLTLLIPGQNAGAGVHYEESPGFPRNACGPCVTVARNANLRAGPGTTYGITGAARASQTLPVMARAAGPANGLQVTWWQTPRGWIAGFLVAPNAAALALPETKDALSGASGRVPAKPPASTSLPDLVVLGPDTRYPVRARVVRGWDYEFVDLSSRYDIVVYRDVFGMLAHQIDDENRRRFFPDRPPIASTGPIRITLVDAEAHPDPSCVGWGWAGDRDTYTPNPLGRQGGGCLVQHSLRPEGDGHGAVLLTGWAPGVGRTIAIGAYGPTGGDWSTTHIAERITWPATLGPADRPDFGQPLYAPLGEAHKEDGRWVWQGPFVQIALAE